MPRTQPRQKNLRSSGADADENLAAGVALATQPSLLGDMNAIRSQLRRVIAHVSAGVHWYDDPGDVDGGLGSTVANKRMPAINTGSDGDLACAIGVARMPIAGSYVGVRINGVDVPDVGDGTKVAASCYFSGDAGVTPRLWTAITVGDTLHWQGTIAGYELTNSDVIDFVYEES